MAQLASLQSGKTWDRGGARRGQVTITDQLYAVIAANETRPSKEYVDATDGVTPKKGRNDIDSHANVPVVGSKAVVLSGTGKIVEVSAYLPDLPKKQIPLVDAAILYECEVTGASYILIIMNALHVPSMTSNLIPPFVMRQKGIVVNDRAKQHSRNPTLEDRAIVFEEFNFKIPLKLSGIFSYFSHRKPTKEDLEQEEEIYLLMPEKFDPHSPMWTATEESYTDYEGNILPPRDCQKILLQDIRLDEAVVKASQVSAAEALQVDCVCEFWENEKTEQYKPWSQTTHGQALTQVSSVLTEVSPLLDDVLLAAKLEARLDLCDLQASMGSTSVLDQDYLVDDATTGDEGSNIEAEDPSAYLLDSLDNEESQAFANEMFDKVIAGELSFEDLVGGSKVSATHAWKPKSIDAEHLSKIWGIDRKKAKGTLDITSQHSTRQETSHLAWNYGTSDRALRYRHIDRYFYMDTFFATWRKNFKSSQGNTCCQLFVSDRGFVYVVPMKSRKKVLQALKMFAKAVGVPEAIICDVSREQTSSDLKKFVNKIGSTLRVLEEGTPWANRAKLYIGLIKEATCKDLKASGAPLAFWDYCLQRRVRINNVTISDNVKIRGTSPYTDIFQQEPDVSNLCQYAFYDWSYFRDQGEQFPFAKERLGRILGPAEGEGNEMCQWVLTDRATVVPRRTHIPLTIAKKNSSVVQKRQQMFDAITKRKHGMGIAGPLAPIKEDGEEEEVPEELSEYETEEEPARRIPEFDGFVDTTGKKFNQEPAWDKLLKSEISIPGMPVGKVARQATNQDGKVQGVYDDNLFINSMVYEVEGGGGG